MSDYRLVWCDCGTVRSVDGLTLEAAQRGFAGICRELRPTLAWVHILRMPERSTYASRDRAELDARDAMDAIMRRPMNVGGELAPEDIA
jgi:hypothetical protein